MKILKFGGTSVGSPGRMMEVQKLVVNEEPKIVVLSAVAGTTNSLVEIAQHLYKKENDQANVLIDELEAKYKVLIKELYNTESGLNKGNEVISSHFSHIRSFTQDSFTLYEEKAILAQGELISTALFHYSLEEKGIDSTLLPALNFMRIDEHGEPDMAYITENLRAELEKHSGEILFITQGYICRNPYGEIDNLRRGGSDYTASLVGAAINATEIQIWTDIDGMHNNDPRFVEETHPISELSFDEAAELAYFGAKILHPSSIRPAKDKNIPVKLLNTMQPDAAGTTIGPAISGSGIKAVAAKEGITAIKIKSGRMLMAYGFLRQIFEVFERYRTPIDMIATSEVAVSLTIDDTTHLEHIVREIEKYGVVEVDQNQAIVCIVGNFGMDESGHALKVFDALKDIPIRMISYGGSRYNVSVLINQQFKNQALKAINIGLFNKRG